MVRFILRPFNLGERTSPPPQPPDIYWTVVTVGPTILLYASEAGQTLMFFPRELNSQPSTVHPVANMNSVQLEFLTTANNQLQASAKERTTLIIQYKPIQIFLYLHAHSTAWRLIMKQALPWKETKRGNSYHLDNKKNSNCE
jgi:hypothetical protein